MSKKYKFLVATAKDCKFGDTTHKQMFFQECKMERAFLTF
jgi:hypothetical protein